LRRQEQEERVIRACSEKSGPTPTETKAWSRVQTLGEIDSPCLRNLNSVNRTINQESVLLKGTDTLHKIRRRELQSIGTENNFALSSPLLNQRILSSEPNKAKNIDQSKALSRLTRSTKTDTTGQRAFSGNKPFKYQLPGIKENDNKSKIWLR
jgi:hypothetical protein